MLKCYKQMIWCVSQHPEKAMGKLLFKKSVEGDIGLKKSPISIRSKHHAVEFQAVRSMQWLRIDRRNKQLGAQEVPRIEQF